MVNNDKTVWAQSVAGVVIREGKVLLARHTYGPGNGKLIIPGGYLEQGELPEDALKREFREETGIEIKPISLIGIRFNLKDWYAVFRAEYVQGIPRSDGDENSEVLWLPINEVMNRKDVPDLTKKLIQCALESGFSVIPYEGRTPPYVLYGAK